MKTVLAPIDFSDVSPRVVAEGVALARALSARLVVLQVVQPPVVTESDLGTQLSAEYAEKATRAAAKQLGALQKELQAGGVTIETRHVVGPPGPCILEQARALRADYLVIGSHGHGAFHALIMGSTTHRVLKQALCPVIVVPAALPPASRGTPARD